MFFEKGVFSAAPLSDTHHVCLFCFVYLFIVGGLGSRGARPRPNRAFHASLPSRQDSARRSPPLSSWNKARYMGKTKEKASLATLQFGLLEHA